MTETAQSHMDTFPDMEHIASQFTETFYFCFVEINLSTVPYPVNLDYETKFIIKITVMKTILYKIIRVYNILLVIIPSIAFYRATVQPEYKWGLLAFQGKGMSSEYWYLLLFMIFSWMTFILEIWYKRKWYYVLPILLFSSVTAAFLYGYISQNEMVFQGDVWKFNFEMGLVFVLVSVILLSASIMWTIIELKNFQESSFNFSKSDKIKFLSGLSTSIIIFLFFAQGRGGVHTITDGIAVGLTIIQALFLASIIDKTGKKN